jgi:hypothetical protein
MHRTILLPITDKPPAAETERKASEPVGRIETYALKIHKSSENSIILFLRGRLPRLKHVHWGVFAPKLAKILHE